MIKVTKIHIENIGLIENETIEINKPLLVFYGEVRAGKSTILNAIRWCMGGAWPTDIIRHGAKEALVRIDFAGGSVQRSWYVSPKDNSTKARDIAFIRDGAQVARPAKEIERLLNPFQANPDYLRNKTEPERKAFFADLLGVDTSHLDAEAAACASQASTLRAEIKAYGEIDPTVATTPPALPNVEDLRARLDVLIEQRDAELDDHAQLTAKVVENNAQIRSHTELRNGITQRIAELQQEIDRNKAALEACQDWLAKHPPQDMPEKPIEPDEIAELQAKINDAAAAAERHKAWQREYARLTAKTESEEKLSQLENRQRVIKLEKARLLKDNADKTGVPGLEFDDLGNVIFEGTAAGMLSTSQLMRLSSALSALYPDGFGFELIDRAESLGKSIYEFIDRAKEKELTILATVVGENPAQSPPEVGVFVVEKGKVKRKT